MSYRFDESIDFFAAGAGAVLISEFNETITTIYSPAGENPIMASTPWSHNFHIDESYMYQLHLNELRILERNERGEFVQIGTYASESTMKDIDASGNTAYIATDEDGILILNISDPTSPQLITTYFPSLDADKVRLFDDLLYYSGDSEVWTVDISNPAALLTVRRILGASDVKNLEVVGGYAYIPVGRQGLKIFDVSDRWNPTLVGQYDTDFDAYDVVVRDQIAYLADYSRIATIDISDPTNPTLLSEIYAFGQVYEILHHNDILYVRNDDWKVLAYSLEDPTLPKLQAELERYTSLSIVGDILFAFDLNGPKEYRITEIDISNRCNSCPGDFTDDGVLDFVDVSTFLEFFTDQRPAADLMSDGIFDFYDVAMFLEHFHAGCP